MPKLSLGVVSRPLGFCGIGSSCATSSVFRRWSTLFTICVGWSFPEPSAR